MDIWLFQILTTMNKVAKNIYAQGFSQMCFHVS